MKKIVFLLALVAFAAVSFGQSVNCYEVPYDSLDIESKKLFSKYGSRHPYGETIKIEADSIIAIYKIVGIPKSRRMVADSTGVTKPEYPDQFLILYKKGGKNHAIVSLDDPCKNNNDQASISALLSQTGVRQGDDEFPESAPTRNSQKNYLLRKEW
jgi:hypothetical protein